MKRLFVTFFILLGMLTVAQAQTACYGLHNPTNFSSLPTSAGRWTARVGDRVQGTGGSTGSNVLSTCARPGKAVITGSDITSSTYYSGACSNRSACGHATIFDGHDHRFTIYSAADAGMDLFTINDAGQGMQRIPPGHTSSIRLGDMRATGQCVNNISTNGNDKGAEALFYTMYVNTKNSLLFIDYAVVACKYDHDPYQAGEFLIRVCGKNPTTNQWENQPLNDNLWFNVPAPHVTGGLPAPWVEGMHGSSQYAGATSCYYCYKPWARVAISLLDYLYDSVRVEIYTSDCIYNVDPIYAYIAGSCQPMAISSSGCPGGASDAVDTLIAPDGLVSYTWYVAADGYDGPTTSAAINDVVFRQVGSGNSRYVSRLDDFITNTGDTVCRTTYKCVVTSAMDPNKPFESVMYVQVSNTKPIVDAAFNYQCDGTVEFEGLGRVCRSSANVPDIVDSLTRWDIHQGGTGDTPIIDTVMGRLASYKFADNQVHAVTLTVYTEDSTCYTTKTFRVQPKVPANTAITIDKRTLCVGEQATITDVTTGITARKWVFEDNTIDSQDPGQSLDNTVTVVRDFTQFANPFMLITTSTSGCLDTLYDTIYFFHDPEISYSNDTIVCNGHETHITASTPVSGCTFAWYRHNNMAGESPIMTGPVLMVRPTQSLTTYYLKIISQAGCEAWDSVTVRILSSKITAEPANGKFCPSRSEDGELAPGEYVTLTGSGAAYYEWYSVPDDPNLVAQAHQQTIQVAPEVDTRYYLIGYAADSCDIAAINFLVQPIAWPVLDVEYSPEFIDTEVPVLNFTDKSEGRDHTQWLFSDGSQTTGEQVTHHFDIYLPDGNCVTMKTYNAIGCALDTTLCIAIDTFGLYVPNVFTPAKSSNNKFTVVCPSKMDQFHIAVFNRRGTMVFESDDQHFVWDGTSNGTPLPTGAYVYVIKYVRAGSISEFKVKGTVLLVR